MERGGDSSLPLTSFSVESQGQLVQRRKATTSDHSSSYTSILGLVCACLACFNSSFFPAALLLLRP